MSDLLTSVLDAHGGLDRWKQRSALSATIVTWGGFWALKGLVQDRAPRVMRVSLHEERGSLAPFGKPDWRTDFSAERVAIVTDEGDIVQERLAPRTAFIGHSANTPWDPLHRAYFNGYAMWSYLTTPFFMKMPGFEVNEIAPWNEGDDEVWRGLRVRFPDYIASHCPEQDFYFGPDFLLRRHDYQVDVAGGVSAAQYMADIVDVDGFKFPTRRRAYLRGPTGHPERETLLVAIDLREFSFA